MIELYNIASCMELGNSQGTMREKVSKQLWYIQLLRDSQGTMSTADRGSLVPTELVANTLTVWFSPLVKFWSSWVTSTDTRL